MGESARLSPALDYFPEDLYPAFGLELRTGRQLWDAESSDQLIDSSNKHGLHIHLAQRRHVRQAQSLTLWRELGHPTGPAIPVGVDVQVESLDSISEVDMFQADIVQLSDVQFLLQAQFPYSLCGSAPPFHVYPSSTTTGLGDFTMTLYLRHYWKDERLAFSSASNKSMTFDGRLVKKIWVPDVFFVHSKRSFTHDTTTDNIMLRMRIQMKI
ncbi:Gamma-aminobutyric acid receptor subunit rho-2 [Saguinus oedipus]|uniref:Gamma-aminobutyric acid receptor subunit rho-2 n=1 Tax=Saguinus oedipus TaxID=9490 RepID=A0ABQ9VYY3_SAGOE|nr:Gamma-aminobutyric acid receptor subunit rho-2 [Saguinus oedipus]